jgi:hypothetical protein
MLLDLGFQPVSNRFYSLDSDKFSPVFPLSIKVSKNTGLIKLEKLFPVEELKPKHDWLTNFEPEGHLDELVEDMVKLPGIDSNSIIGAYSFKDDSTIERLNRKDFSNTWRIDPEFDLGVDKYAGIETYQQEFTIDKARKIKEKYGAADIFLVRHVVEHAYNISKFVNAIRLLIKPNGYIIWELPSCEKALSNGDPVMIWEEHIYYFTKFTFEQFLIKEKICINNLRLVSYPLEDCIIAITQGDLNGNADIVIDKKAVNYEVERAKKYIELIHQKKRTIPRKISNIRDRFGKVVIFGAGHFSVAFISILGMENLIDFIIDDNPDKKGKKLPGGSIPIVDSNFLNHKDITICLLGLNPQNHNKIIKKHKNFINNGGIFASIFPGTESYFEDIL